MSETTTPPKPWEVERPDEDPPLPRGWYRGMPSPNPAGRPKITDRKAKLSQRMLDDAPAIISVLIAQALEGDVSAASLILSRCLPAIRNQTEKVAFPFDASGPLARQAEQVLDAVAAGAVAPDVGQLILQSMKALADVRGFEELEARIITLEAREVR